MSLGAKSRSKEIMDIYILIWLLIWSNLVKKCMAGCAIQPDSNGHVTIPDDWSGGGR